MWLDLLASTSKYPAFPNLCITSHVVLYASATVSYHMLCLYEKEHLPRGKKKCLGSVVRMSMVNDQEKEVFSFFRLRYVHIRDRFKTLLRNVIVYFQIEQDKCISMYRHSTWLSNKSPPITIHVLWQYTIIKKNP